MPTQKKIDQVAELEDKLKRSSIVISTEFRGVTVAQVTDLRKQLRAKGVEYLVVKNTLASIAAKNSGKPGLSEVLKGPSAIAFGYGDPVEPAKVLTDHIRTSRITVTVNGAVLGTQVLMAADVQNLAGTPPKPVLISKLLGSLKGPLYQLVRGLNFHTAGLARVLEARRKQLEAAQAPPPEATPAPAA